MSSLHSHHHSCYCAFTSSDVFTITCATHCSPRSMRISCRLRHPPLASSNVPPSGSGFGVRRRRFLMRYGLHNVSHTRCASAIMTWPSIPSHESLCAIYPSPYMCYPAHHLQMQLSHLEICDIPVHSDYTAAAVVAGRLSCWRAPPNVHLGDLLGISRFVALTTHITWVRGNIVWGHSGQHDWMH